jgi:hypothetical protein
VEVQAVRGRRERRVRREEERHGGQGAGRRQAGVVRPRRLVGQQAGALERGGVVAQAVLDGLEVGDQHAERPALHHVVDADLQRAAGEPDESRACEQLPVGHRPPVRGDRLRSRRDHERRRGVDGAVGDAHGAEVRQRRHRTLGGPDRQQILPPQHDHDVRYGPGGDHVRDRTGHRVQRHGRQHVASDGARHQRRQLRPGGQGGEERGRDRRLDQRHRGERPAQDLGGDGELHEPGAAPACVHVGPSSLSQRPAPGT